MSIGGRHGPSTILVPGGAFFCFSIAEGPGSSEIYVKSRE